METPQNDGAVTCLEESHDQTVGCSRKVYLSLSGSTEMLCLSLQVSLDCISVQLTVAPCSMVAELGFYTVN